jgi:hypothetical protein
MSRLKQNLMMMMSFICSCRNNNQPTAIYPLGTILDVLAHAARDSHAHHDFMRCDFHHG